jgi:hypothetical protein
MTPSSRELQDLEIALARVKAASVAAYQAADYARCATGAADAANVAVRAANVAVRAADVALRAADVASAAKAAAKAAKSAAKAAGRAANVAGMADVAGAADSADAANASNAAIAAKQAFLEAARVFTGLVAAYDVPKRSTHVPAAVRPLGRVTVRLVTLSAAMLPVGHRGRYCEEWSGLLFELGNRRSRARQVVSIVAGAPPQAWALRHPLEETPPA